MFKLDELKTKSVLILGLGVEGLSTLNFLRELFPEKRFGIADRGHLEQLDAESRATITADSGLELHLGENYLSVISSYDIVIKTPGISVARHPEIQSAVQAGKLTSHTSLFFANCPGTIVGVTGTKGKGTTSKLIHGMLKAGGLDAHLVGNIGNPPLPLLKQAGVSSIFVFELSAQQLETIQQSPHIAVLLNVVPDHLDHFVSFENYVTAKENVARYQNENDYLICNPSFAIPGRIANKARSKKIICSTEASSLGGCFVEDGQIVCWFGEVAEKVVGLPDIEEVLPGSFNLNNVVPAVAAARLLGVEIEKIVQGIRDFKPQEYRFDKVGTFRGVAFYNASIATVPEVTIEHLGSLGADVQTMLLGGFDRGMDFSVLAARILESGVKTVILFPETGSRIWDAIRAKAAEGPSSLPRHVFINRAEGPELAMREAVRLAYLHTEPGKVCLHSPASPSFGLFKDYKHRGELFKRWVNELAEPSIVT